MAEIQSFKELQLTRAFYKGEERLVKLFTPRRYQGHGRYEEPSHVGRHMASMVSNILLGAGFSATYQGAQLSETNSGLRHNILHISDVLIRHRIREPAIDRPAKVKRGVTVKDALWSPNFIGRSYTCPVRPASEPTGIKVRMHFRRGHWRWQAHGKGRKDRKLKLIDEMWINLDEELGTE